MLKARYDIAYATGVICAGGTLGILIPPSILLIVYAATSGVSVVRMYAAALLPGLFLAGLYLVYVVGKALLQPQLAPKPTDGTGRRTFVPRDLLDDVHLLRAAGLPHPGRARRHPVRAGDAVGGRRDRRARRPAARRRLSGADLAAAEGKRLSDRAHLGDGVLAVRRIGDLRVDLRLSRRPAVHQPNSSPASTCRR